MHTMKFPRLFLLAVLLVLSLTLPALAIFRWDTAVPGHGPVAADLRMSTVQDTPAKGTLAGWDPQGGAVQFRVTKNPARGAVTLTGNGGYTYTPYEGKTGKDRFTYVAVNEQGEVSEPAKVYIEIWADSDP